MANARPSCPMFLLGQLEAHRWMAWLFLSLAAAIPAWGANAPAALRSGGNCFVYFSPKGGCTEAVVSNLTRATNSVLVQAYTFTSAPIAKALVEAHRRGVKVQVMLDKGQEQEQYTSATFLTHAGIPTFIDARHAIAHDKVMIIDDRTVITGSFNFTKAAEESNAENLLVIHDAGLARQYTENWQSHREHSLPYGERSKTQAPKSKYRRRH